MKSQFLERFRNSPFSKTTILVFLSNTEKLLFKAFIEMFTLYILVERLKNYSYLVQQNKKYKKEASNNMFTKTLELYIVFVNPFLFSLEL